MQLVCPAGNLPALQAAVGAGADAVYAGFRDQTNAREHPDGLPLATRDGTPFLRINGIQVQGEDVLDLGPELPALRELGVDVLRIAPRDEASTLEAIAHFARRSHTPPPAVAARSGYWHGEAGMALRHGG